jgi:hypothetical protein
MAISADTVLPMLPIALSGFENEGNNRFRVTVAGVYKIHAQVLANTGAGLTIYLQIRKNFADAAHAWLNASQMIDMQVDYLGVFEKGDYIDFFMDLTAAVNVTMWGGTHSSFSAFCLGAV